MDPDLDLLPGLDLGFDFGFQIVVEIEVEIGVEIDVCFGPLVVVFLAFRCGFLGV